jgi:hypothetical protein
VRPSTVASLINNNIRRNAVAVWCGSRACFCGFSVNIEQFSKGAGSRQQFLATYVESKLFCHMCGKSEFWPNLFIYWPAGLQFIYVSIGLYLRLVYRVGNLLIDVQEESKKCRENSESVGTNRVRKFTGILNQNITFVPRGNLF